MSQQRDSLVHDVLHQHSTLLLATDCYKNQEHGQESNIADPECLLESDDSPPTSGDLLATRTQHVKTLLEQGEFEAALSLTCDSYRDPELGKDPVFLETALILFTNMGKSEEMWTEIKVLQSMEQLYPTAKALSQYCMPAALLTAEMLLCKEWCQKTIAPCNLQQITLLWVALLWNSTGHDKEALESKVLSIGKLIVHEPTFILNLVKAIHDKVGEISLVLCVNLCLMAIQKPLEDPQSNLLTSSHIDTNNSALCNQLSVLLGGDSSLKCLCLLTAFGITPTKELFAELDRAHKSSMVEAPAAPLLPSCLSCILVHCMYSLLPTTISPVVDWKFLRGQCLQYLHSSTMLNVQVKLPHQEVTVKMYVKKSADDQKGQEDKENKARSTRRKTGIVEDVSNETQDLSDGDECRRIKTDSELHWLSSMLWLDMTWRPHWLGDDHDQEAQCSTHSHRNDPLDLKCVASVNACQQKLPSRDVDSGSTKDTTLEDTSEATLDRQDLYRLHDMHVEESTASQEMLPSHDADPCITRDATQQDTSEATLDRQDLIRLDSMHAEESKACQEMLPLRDADPRNTSDAAQLDTSEATLDRQDLYRLPSMHVEESTTADILPPEVDHSYSLPPVQEDRLAQELCKDQDLSGLEETNTQNTSEVLASSGSDDHLFQNGINRTDLESIQHVDSDIPAAAGLRNQPSEVIEMSTPGKQCNTNPVDTFENLDKLVSEFPGTESENNLQSTSSPECQDRQKVGSTDFMVDVEFLQELTDSLVDVHPNEMTTEEVDRWFQNVDQPSETSSIIADEVTPDPITEQGLQWTAVKSITSHENPVSDTPGWCDFDLWAPEYHSCQRDSLCDTDPGSSNSQNWMILEPEDEPKKEANSLESTIRRLRGNLCSTDKVASTPSINQQTVSQQSTRNASTRHQPSGIHSCECFSKQNSTEQLSMPAEFNSKEPDPQLTILSPTNHDATDKLSSRPQIKNRETENTNQADQQWSNHQSKPGRRTKIKPHPSLKPHLTLDTKVTDDDMVNQCSPINRNLTVCRSVKEKFAVHKMPAEQSLSTKQSIVEQQSINKQSTNQQAAIKTSTPKNGCITAPKASTIHHPLITECNALVSITETLTSTTASNKDTLCLSPLKETPSRTDRNSREMDSSACHVILKGSPQNPKSQVPNQSKKELFGSLLCAASQEFDLLTELKIPASFDKPTLGESSDDRAIRCLEKPTTMPEVEHKGFLNAHSGSALEGESSVRTSAFCNGQSVALTAKRDSPKAGGCSLRCREFDQDTKSETSLLSSNMMQIVQSIPSGNGDLKKPVAHPDQDNNTGDSFSDSDCSEFELVQDMNTSWSVSGKRTAIDTSTLKKEKVLPLDKTKAPVRAGKVQSSSPATDKTSVILEADKNELEAVERVSPKSFSLPINEEKRQQEMEHSILDRANEMLVISSPDEKKVEEGKQIPGNEVDAAEPVAEMSRARSPPHGHSYNLRAATSVKYVVAGSSTDAEVSSETSGEDKGLKRAYRLRSSAKDSASIPKKPRKAAKPSRQSMQKKAPMQSALAKGKTACPNKPKEVFQKSCRTVQLELKQSPAVLSDSNSVSDQNNNHHLSSGVNSGKVQRSPSSTLGNNKAAESRLMTERSSAHTNISNLAASECHVLSLVKNPQLPWETKPPLRTYSSRKNLSSIM